MIRLADNKPAVCINTRDDSRVGIYLSTAQFRAIRVICLLPESDLDFFRTRAVLIIMVVPDLLHGQLDSFLAGIFFVSGIRHQTLVICRSGRIRHQYSLLVADIQLDKRGVVTRSAGSELSAVPFAVDFLISFVFFRRDRSGKMGDIKPLISAILHGAAVDQLITACQRIGRIRIAINRVNIVFALDGLDGVKAVNRLQIGVTAERTD